jgi:hypothetical protein
MHPAGGNPAGGNPAGGNPAGGDDWQPASPLERALLAAVEAGDAERYGRLLAGAEVLLPITAAAAAGDEPVAWSVTEVGDTRCLLAFTSPAAMRVAGAQQARTTALRDLVAGWPDPAYLLLLDPLTPLQARLDLAALARLTAVNVTEQAGNIMQAFIPPRRVHRMLTRNDGLISGYAVELGDVEHLDTLSALRAALPLARIDPAITPDLAFLHLVRWPVTRVAKYKPDTDPDGPTHGTGYLPGVEPAVPLYKIPATKLPDAAELLQVGLNDPTTVLATWNANARSWEWKPTVIRPSGESI